MIEELVLSVKNGTGDSALLWKAVKKLIYSLANKYYENGCENRADLDVEDFYQAGYFAMLAAVKDYDPGKGYAFTTYLTNHCRNQFNSLAGYRTESQRTNQTRAALRKAESLDAPILEDESLTLLDKTASDADPIRDAEDRIFFSQAHAAIESALQKLPAEAAEIIRRKYWNGESIKEIAASLNSTESRCRVREKETLRALKRPSYGLERFINLNYYRHVGVSAFRATGTSAVELLALKRMLLEGLEQAP